ncbi:hypothetical protein ACFY5A_14910 [Microbacterium sp. NPDC012755]|uniref:hypothetical protein n=1 Tax=Microbacterium sp. NPDC012755 TaxID=3364184 RepID=UPI0036A4FDA8
MMMYGALMLALSEPSADNVGEEGIAAGLGVLGWGAGLIVALLAGWRLARRAARYRWWLRALPLLVSPVWMLLAQAALYSGWSSSIVEGAQPLMDTMSSVSLALWPIFVQSVYGLCALPISIVLFLAFLALISVRSIRRTQDIAPACPAA